MIIYKVWTEYQERGLNTIVFKYEGYFLFGIIPLFVKRIELW